jgi:hypothetical protein
MPTKRTLRTRGRRQDVPAWVSALIDERRAPRPQGPADYDQFMGWRYFGESVPGLPAADTEAGRAILQRAKVTT